MNNSFIFSGNDPEAAESPRVGNAGTHTPAPVVLGEFGRFGGREVYRVRTVPGHVMEIRRLWAQLDEPDAPREDEIFARLAQLGSLSQD